MKCSKPSLKKQQETKKKIAESVIKSLFVQNRLSEVIEVAQKNNINQLEFAQICESIITK